MTDNRTTDCVRNPFYAVADALGVNCADRTDERIAERMLEVLTDDWMELPKDMDGLTVHIGDAYDVWCCGDSEFGKLLAVADNNHAWLDMPKFDYPQDVNAHSLKQRPPVDDYGNEILDGGIAHDPHEDTAR